MTARKTTARHEVVEREGTLGELEPEWPAQVPERPAQVEDGQVTEPVGAPRHRGPHQHHVIEDLLPTRRAPAAYRGVVSVTASFVFSVLDRQSVG